MNLLAVALTGQEESKEPVKLHHWKCRIHCFIIWHKVRVFQPLLLWFWPPTHPSVHPLPPIQGWVAVAASLAGCSGHPSRQQRIQAYPGDPKAFPDHMGNIVPPTSSGSAPGVLLPVGLAQNTSKWRNPGGILIKFWTSAGFFQCDTPSFPQMSKLLIQALSPANPFGPYLISILMEATCRITGVLLWDWWVSNCFLFSAEPCRSWYNEVTPKRGSSLLRRHKLN